MRRIISQLPRINKRVHWEETVGKVIKVEYGSKEYNILVKAYNEYKKHYLTIVLFKEDNDYKEWDFKFMHTSTFLKCAFGDLVAEKFYKKMLERNDIRIDYEKTLIEYDLTVRSINSILSCSSAKKLWFLCNKENHSFVNTPSSIHGQGISCPYCSNSKCLAGFNDIETTDPWMIKYLYNKEDKNKYMKGSNKKIFMICPDCGEKTKKEIMINDLNRKKTINCLNCSSGMSLGEKILYYLLEGLNLDFLYDTTFKWSKKKRYDFVIKDLKLVIEVDGSQHFSIKGFDGVENNLDKQQKNDQFKEKLFEKHKASEGLMHFERIRSDKTDFEYIKQNIIPILNKYIDLSYIDWNIIFDKVYNESFMKRIYILWNEGKNTFQISKILKFNRSTIIRYLKIANEVGRCNYDSEEEMIKGRVKAVNNSKIRCSEKVKCVWNGKEIIFDSMKDAKRKLGIKRTMAENLINSKKPYKIPKMGLNKEDYERVSKFEGMTLEYISSNNITQNKGKKVLCMKGNDRIVFNSRIEACNNLGIGHSVFVRLIKSQEPYKVSKMVLNRDNEYIEHLKSLEGIVLKYMS